MWHQQGKEAPTRSGSGGCGAQTAKLCQCLEGTWHSLLLGQGAETSPKLVLLCPGPGLSILFLSLELLCSSRA